MQHHHLIGTIGEQLVATLILHRYPGYRMVQVVPYRVLSAGNSVANDSLHEFASASHLIAQPLIETEFSQAVLREFTVGTTNPPVCILLHLPVIHSTIPYAESLEQPFKILRQAEFIKVHTRTAPIRLFKRKRFAIYPDLQLPFTTTSEAEGEVMPSTL